MINRSIGVAVLVALAVPLGSVSAWDNAPDGQAAALHCGVERWAVKTLSDPAASQVNFTPVRATVKALNQQTVPAGLGPSSPRTDGVEKTTFKVRARLIHTRYVGKSGEDRDIHLVIADPDSRKKTMIVEFPDIQCEGAADSIKKNEMGAARRAFERSCGKPPTSFVDLRGTAQITGIGFFDEKHGQKGVADNAIELHPVLDFKGSNCKRKVNHQPRKKKKRKKKGGGGNCDPSYPGQCIPSPPPDLDCGDVAKQNFPVKGSDPHGFDADGDGVGCES